MAENENAGQGGNGAAEAVAPPKMQILGQLIRDMSFENVLAQKGTAADGLPQVSVQVSLDAKKRSVENQYEVVTKYIVTAKSQKSDDTLFLLELEYSGIFHIENVPDAQLHPFLMIECPRMLFPFARRIVHDVVRDGGFMPVNLEPIDWVRLYRDGLARQAAAQQAAAADAPVKN